jgi:hypothetical protein
MDVRVLPLFEDSIRTIFPKADPHGARRQARDCLLVRRPIILSLGSYLLSLVSSFSINIVDLGCPKKGQSADALTGGRASDEKKACRMERWFHYE